MFVINQGFAPLHPFIALPYKYFDDGYFTKEETMNYCLKLVEICEELWAFGESDGVLMEKEYAKKSGKVIRDFKVGLRIEEISDL